MNPTELDGKILYFEMHTHPPDKSALFFVKGWAKMHALSGGHVTISWPDYPGASSFGTVTFKPEDVARFWANDSRQAFDLRGTPITPDFIYMEQPRAL